ncbi:alpha/beta fold hydrolase [Leptolyngbya sp. NIES-2104]|uniref:alpha/beta fold hydrolase n=1 Tax=Leptolyngbya sp. NIES-2104 TaxID=1552121 RepID=UPI0006EC66EC|nr:alpha/beta hydrolase [Leptolyngbya sp. NIES-2104]GAP94454.1 alpha/beta hydrolase fold [Leptolyngbya sp. NIES-2104]
MQKHIIQVQLDFDRLNTVPAAYFEVGGGTPIIMLHGFMGEASCWLPLSEQLKSNFRCIGLDLLGFGQSARPMIRYDIAKEVAFLRQVVETLKLESFYLLGHSFGGWVSAAYALQYPVKGLILAAPAGIRDDSFAGRYDHLRPILWETPAIDWGLELIKPIANLFGQEKTIGQIAWMRRELTTQPAARSFLVDRLRPEDAIDTVEKEIHRLTVPTLVITGDRDETIPLWHSETYANEIPNAKLVILPNADHSLPQKFSLQLATQITQWSLTH